MKIIRNLLAKYLITISLFSIIGLLAGCSPATLKGNGAAQYQAPDDFSKKMDEILADSALAQSSLGIKIVSLRSGRTLYARNNQLLFHPASNMKLLSTATALKKLGPDFRFKTEIYTDSLALDDSTVSGNLYIKGYGDPDLTSDDLAELIRDLKYKGIKNIMGNIVCDATYFDDLKWGSGWMWDDVSSWAFASISALSINDNCVIVRIKPGENIGDTLQVSLEPQTDYVRIENTALTVDSLDTVQTRNFDVERQWRPEENVIKITGGLRLDSPGRTRVVDVIDPPLYTGTLFAEMLKDQGIIFDGQVENDTVPESAELLSRHFSEPLTYAVINTNKVSDNLSAELLVKTLAAEQTDGQPGTSEKGLSIINQFLDEAGADTTMSALADGSGVSRYNKITADLIISLLQHVYEDFGISAEYLTSLPVAGVDGTLSSRMKESIAQGKLRAKTGTLNGVCSLSGYTTSADNEPFAFSILVEHFVVPTSKIRKVQDRIGILLSGYSRASR